jgi:hypothetical protein
MRFVGFDPGGDKAFGWAALLSTPSGLELLGTGTCSSAPDAVHSAHKVSGVAPAGFATDAPLFWVASGDRKADSFVRKLVCSAGGRSGTVSHVNSLRGACLVQGVQVTRLATAQWPSAKATEAHPKALLLLDRGAREFLSSVAGSVKTEHERDAAIAAYTAAAFINQTDGWHDLVLQERDPFFPGGSNAAYWFPRAKT